MVADQDKPPRAVDYVALALIILFGVIITIVLLSRSHNTKEPLNLIVQTVSALATAAAAIAAFLTVRAANDTLKQAREERREERFDRRPYFSYLSGFIGKYYDEEEDHYDEDIKVSFKQVGINPASDITVTATIIMPLNVNEQFVSTVKIYRAVNDVAANAEFNVSISALNLADRNRHHYVVLDLEYYDAIYRTPGSFQQRIYMQWAGLDPLDENEQKHSLVPITREAKPWIINMLNSL